MASTARHQTLTAAIITLALFTADAHGAQVALELTTNVQKETGSPSVVAAPAPTAQGLAYCPKASPDTVAGHGRRFGIRLNQGEVTEHVRLIAFTLCGNHAASACEFQRGRLYATLQRQYGPAYVAARIVEAQALARTWSPGAQMATKN